MITYNFIIMLFNIIVAGYSFSVFKNIFHWACLLNIACAIWNGYYVYLDIIK